MRVLGLLLLLFLALARPASAQTRPALRTPEEFGYRHMVVMFGKDSVDGLVLPR